MGAWSLIDTEEKRARLGFLGAGAATVIAGIWAAFVYFHPPKTDDKPLPVEKTYVAPESYRLRQREDAKALFDAVWDNYRVGIESTSDVVNANNKLLEADLALSTELSARVSAYRAALKRAKELEAAALDHFIRGTALQKEVSEAKLHHTQIEIGLAREETK
jgi:hypothetical protein